MGFEGRPENKDVEFQAAMDILLEMRGASSINEELQGLFDDVRFSIARYNQTIARLNHIERRMKRNADVSNDEIQNADEARRRAHDALMDNLNILSRGFAKHGLDNHWRKLIGLDAREQVTEWAVHVGEFLAKEKEAQKDKEVSQ